MEEYVERGDLVRAGAVAKSVERYLVGGLVAVDVMNLSEIHPDLFRRLREEASVEVRLGGAGTVRAVSREGYFVLAVMAGIRGFARSRADPMAKVRETWGFIGARVDRGSVESLLRDLTEGQATLEAALSPPGETTGKRRRGRF